MTVAISPSLPHDLFTSVDTVVFDVVGTLLEPAPSVSEAYKKSSEKFGVTLSSSEIAKRFSIAWEKQESLDAQNNPAFSTSRSREYERWQQIVCDVFEDSPAAGNIFEDLLPLAKHVEPLISIEKIFASSELGWRKPAPQFFQAVESRLQKEPDQLLLVGDDPRLDIAAANAAGWKSMRIG